MILGDIGWSKRERKESLLRQRDRIKEKAQLIQAQDVFSDKKSKLRLVKEMERTPSFQEDLRKMKELLVDTKHKPMFKESFNALRPSKDFMKSKTDIDITSFDKQFKKKRDFILL